MESDNSSRVEIPAAFEDAHVDDLVQLIADMLNRVMVLNDRIPLSPESLTRFHSQTPPTISILDYLRRIVQFTNIEKSCLIIILLNIDRICASLPLFILSSLTCHRFIITSIAVSSKGLCDAFSPNHLYARVGGIPLAELNILEREFLSMIDWRLMCKREVLQEYYVNLVRTHSSGKFYIASESPGNSSDSDVDFEIDMDSEQSTPSTPIIPRHSIRLSTIEPAASAALLEPVTAQETPLLQRPTVEQNMAFAALQLQHSQEFQSSASANRQQGSR